MRRRATGKLECLFRFFFWVLTAFHRLQSILKKRSLAPQKLDEVKIKANILSTFKVVEEKAEEAVEKLQEKVEEALGHDAAEL